MALGARHDDTSQTGRKARLKLGSVNAVDKRRAKSWVVRKEYKAQTIWALYLYSSHWILPAACCTLGLSIFGLALAGMCEADRGAWMVEPLPFQLGRRASSTFAFHTKC